MKQRHLGMAAALLVALMISAAPVAASDNGPSGTPPPVVALTPASPNVMVSAASAPVRLVLPALKIDVPVTRMIWGRVKTARGQQIEWLIPENAAGHAANSASLGQVGNVVIAGHNNIYGRVFEKISKAWPKIGFQRDDAYTDRSSILNGQPITVYGADGRQATYEVTAFYRVKDSGVPLAQREVNASRFIGHSDEALLTLTTCWPPQSNTHRLVLVARLVAK